MLTHCIDPIPRNKFQLNLINILCQEYAFKNTVDKLSAILFRHRRQHNLFPGIDVIYKHVIVMHLRSTPRGLEWIIDGYSDLTMQQSQFIIVHQSNVKCVSNDDFYIKHCLSLTYIYCLNLPWPCDAMWQQQCWLSEELTLIKYQSKHNNSRKCIRKFHLQKAFCSSLSIGTIVTVPRKQAVWCRYNAVNFLTNFHKRHPIARPLGRGMWCLLRIQHLIDFCLSSCTDLGNILLDSTVL